MKGRDRTMKKINQVGHTVLGTVGPCILKVLRLALSILQTERH